MAGGRGDQRFRNGGTFVRLATRPAVQHEKIQQGYILELAALVVVRVEGVPSIWVLGTRRSRGRSCPKCGEFVAEHQGLRQTPGHPDVVMFLKPIARHPSPRILYWETKAGTNKASADQGRFLNLAESAGAWVGVGDYNAFIAFLVGEGYITTDSVPHYRRPPAAAGGTSA